MEEHSNFEIEELGAANPGLVRPPVVYLVAIILGVLVDKFMPLKIPIDFWAKPIGGMLFISGLAIFILTRREFMLASTPISGNRATTAIISTGPFKFSRNPIYLAFSLIQSSIAFWFQNSWILFTLTFAVIVMSFFVIPREERYMTIKFGSEYKAYKSNVRRWV